MTKPKGKRKSLAGWTARDNIPFILQGIKYHLMEEDLTLSTKPGGWENPIKIRIIIEEIAPKKTKQHTHRKG